MSDELLEVRDLTVTFGARGSRRRGAPPLRAVDGVALRVGAGELVALVGESGCGKTTTANAILRLVDPVAGSIRLRGREISRLRGRALRQVRRELQLVFQDPYEALDPRHRVRQIVEQPLRIHGIGASGEERAAHVAAALERVGLDPASRYLERFSHELSGGQRQRVSIAATLALEPALLVADEPVSMLDVSVRSGILALLAELKAGGMGILMITHDLATAARYADRIAVMYMGRIVEQGAARAVVGDPRHPYTRALVAAVPPRDPRRRIELPAVRGEVADATAVPSGCAFRTRCPLAVQACSETRPALAQPARAAQGHEAACVRLDARTPVGA